MLYTQFCNSPNLCLLVYQTTSCIYAALWLLQPLRRVSRSWGSSFGCHPTSCESTQYCITSPHVTRSPRDFPLRISLLHYITACDDKISQGLPPLYFIITLHHCMWWQDLPGTSPFVFHYITCGKISQGLPPSYFFTYFHPQHPYRNILRILLLHYITACDEISQGLPPLYMYPGSDEAVKAWEWG